METVCHKQLIFESLFSKEVVADFEGGRITSEDLRRLSDWLLELYLKTYPGPRKVIVLDMDATDDPTHGKQQLSFFHDYCEEHMYHPLLVFDGRPGNTRGSHGALAMLKRLIRKLKKAYPEALILYQAESWTRPRRIWVHLASGYPFRDLLAVVLQNLRASPG